MKFFSGLVLTLVVAGAFAFPAQVIEEIAVAAKPIATVVVSEPVPVFKRKVPIHHKVDLDAGNKFSQSLQQIESSINQARDAQVAVDAARRDVGIVKTVAKTVVIENGIPITKKTTTVEETVQQNIIADSVLAFIAPMGQRTISNAIY